jgi:uracil-DNA glycosylase
VLRASASARIAIIGQAPGTKVHRSGIPWDDPSGERLRSWLAVAPDQFYDERLFAIVPMGFCYPGRLERGGDAPPRPECAPLWHARLLQAMPKLGLTLLVGQYAQRHYLDKARRKTLTETVRNYSDYLPRYFCTPHPSWRVNLWMRKNPWFEQQIVPDLRRRTQLLLDAV